MKNVIVKVICVMQCAIGYSETIRFKALVIDSESQKPIKGAKVAGWFHNSPRSWWGTGETEMDYAYTDSNGFCSLSGSSDRKDVSAAVWSADGYYTIESIPNCIPKGSVKIPCNQSSKSILGGLFAVKPVVTMQVDKVRSPIPLKVKVAELPFGKTFKAKPLPLCAPISYDLMIGDWLPPYGEGRVSDIDFIMNRTSLGQEPYEYPSGIKTNEFYRYDVKAKFVGLKNGVIEKITTNKPGVKLRIAPDDGYTFEYVCWRGRISRTEYKNNYDPNRCFYFRIRTETNENGKVQKAYYGKIYGDFKLCQTDEGITDIAFLYYLNPTPNDRNLEWDMKNNLCPVQKRISNPQP